jgi:hypothetical protein
MQYGRFYAGPMPQPEPRRDPIVVVPYREEWPASFADQQVRVEAALRRRRTPEVVVLLPVDRVAHPPPAHRRGPGAGLAAAARVP